MNLLLVYQIITKQTTNKLQYANTTNTSPQISTGNGGNNSNNCIIILSKLISKCKFNKITGRHFSNTTQNNKRANQKFVRFFLFIYSIKLNQQRNNLKVANALFSISPIAVSGNLQLNLINICSRIFFCRASLFQTSLSNRKLVVSK